MVSKNFEAILGEKFIYEGLDHALLKASLQALAAWLSIDQGRARK
jgi:hypothetical protein